MMDMKLTKTESGSYVFTFCNFWFPVFKNTHSSISNFIILRMFLVQTPKTSTLYALMTTATLRVLQSSCILRS